MNLERRRDPKPTCACVQLAGEINNHPLGLAGWRAKVHVHLLPCAGDFRFESRKWEWQIGYQRASDVRHSTAKSQPGGNRQHQWLTGGQRTKIERHGKRLRKA